MSSVSRLHLIFICITMIVVSLACSLVTGAAESVSPGVAQPATSVPSQQGAMPTAVPQGAPQSGPLFTLSLPDGQSVALQVTSCTGTGNDQSLDMRAVNIQDAADPNRVEVQVGGTHQGFGQVINMFVTITIGAKDAWTFMGNTATATITLESNGSGHFEGVGIINAAVSPAYKNGQEYKFGAVWSCGQ